MAPHPSCETSQPTPPDASQYQSELAVQERVLRAALLAEVEPEPIVELRARAEAARRRYEGPPPLTRTQEVALLRKEAIANVHLPAS